MITTNSDLIIACLAAGGKTVSTQNSGCSCLPFVSGIFSLYLHTAIKIKLVLLSCSVSIKEVVIVMKLEWICNPLTLKASTEFQVTTCLSKFGQYFIANIRLVSFAQNDSNAHNYWQLLSTQLFFTQRLENNNSISQFFEVLKFVCILHWNKNKIFPTLSKYLSFNPKVKFLIPFSHIRSDHLALVLQKPSEQNLSRYRYVSVKCFCFNERVYSGKNTFCQKCSDPALLQSLLQ